MGLFLDLKKNIFIINEIKYKGNLKLKNEFCFTTYIEIYPWFLFFTLLNLFYFIQIILNRNSFMKIKNLKSKHQNLNSKLNELHFVEFTQNIPLVIDWKSAPKGITIVCFHLFVKFDVVHKIIKGPR
jgi:hypothetical protein